MQSKKRILELEKLIKRQTAKIVECEKDNEDLSANEAQNEKEIDLIEINLKEKKKNWAKLKRKEIDFKKGGRFSVGDR
jgi:hypothetical protein